MKKTLLTLGAVVAFAAGASAQGYLNIVTPNTAGFNTVSSNPNDSGTPAGTYSDFISGTVALQLFTLTSAGNASIASSINTLAASASTEGQAISDLSMDGFTQQAFGTQGGGVGGEALTNNITLSTGSGNLGIEIVGTSGLSSTTDIYYALLATYVSGSTTYQGVLVMDAVAGYLPGSSTQPNTLSTDWGNSQNLLLAPVPEPATLALAGLGGLSMLFLRRRKN
jgi:hypothetical protein